jgi:hypothetical protein
MFAAAACGYPPLNHLTDDARLDATSSLDAPPDALVCYGTFLRVCFAAPPAASMMLTTMDIDTDASPLCDQQNDQKIRYCVVAGIDFTIRGAQTITAHGNKALVLLSTTTFDMSGAIDVSSNRSGRRGPGADPAGCMNGTPPVVSGGGYGGSFQGKGGNGSDGNPADGKGGAAASPLIAFPAVLRGGCAGGNGIAVGGTGEGTAGSGGGAVAIIATQVHLDGNINASGAGGRGGTSNAKSGGGGGGSGGMIVLDTPTIQLNSRARIWANGGGGAQGGAAGMAGNSGNESTAPDSAGFSTNGTTKGGNGGGGSVGATLVGSNGLTDALSGGGGGGGGGGAGFTHAAGVTGAAVISPPSSGL